MANRWRQTVLSHAARSIALGRLFLRWLTNGNRSSIAQHIQQYRTIFIGNKSIKLIFPRCPSIVLGRLNPGEKQFRQEIATEQLCLVYSSVVVEDSNCREMSVQVVLCVFSSDGECQSCAALNFLGLGSVSRCWFKQYLCVCTVQNVIKIFKTIQWYFSAIRLSPTP